MATIKIRYFKWRDGRPRWEPGPTVRAQGFKGQNLKDSQGRWLSMPAAITAAEALNADLDAFRLGQPRKTRQNYITQRTTNALFQSWYSSHNFKDLAPRTQKDYRYNGHKFLGIFSEIPVAKITKPMMHEYYVQIRKKHGLTMSSAIIATARAALSYAEIIGWIAENTNPALRLKVKKAPPRTVLWLPQEVSEMVKTADEMGLHSVGDGIIIAAHAGQRPADTLSLPDHIFTKNRIMITQAKRGAKVDIPMTPLVMARINQIRTRKRRNNITSIETLITYEPTGRPYRNEMFAQTFAKVRKQAIITMPEIKGKTFQDLRDTAVTRLALAGCEVYEICAITGHSQRRAHDIMRHYMVLTADMADTAIDKLNIWMKKEGIIV